MKIFVAVLAALSLLPLAATAQIKQTPGSHVHVTVCDPHLHTLAQAHAWTDPYGIYHPINHQPFPYEDAFLAITYTNRGKIDATEVDFGLVSRGWLIAVARDEGKFSPGIAIDHEFVVSREIFPLGTALPYCAVLRVKYADGSVWVNPSPPSS